MSDSPVWMPTLRASWTLAGANDKDESPPPVPLEVALEGDLSYAGGRDRIDLQVGEHVNLGGASFTGPAEIRSSFNLWVLGFSGRLRARPAEWISADAILGMEASRFDIRLRGAGESESEAIFSIGPRGGLRVTGHLTEWLDIQAQGSLSYGLAVDWETARQDAEVAVAVRPWSGVALLAGWRWWRYRAEPSGYTILSYEDDSDLKANLSGPVVGLQFDF